jgi:hypothetical protein
LARRALLLLALLAGLAFAPLARADGDPASDYLLSQSTFVPPDDGVPAAYAEQLQATVREAKARGYAIRVALIGTRYDLGSVSVLDRKPKQYARFLGQELAFVYKGRLLVVMPNGLGYSERGRAVPRGQAVVDSLAAPGKDGAALASAATSAVVRLAAAAGVVVPEAPLGSGARTSGSNANRDRLTIAAAALAATLLAAGAVLFRRRRR